MNKKISSGPTITINVTPLFQQRNQIICAIEPPQGNAKGGMVRLDKGKACTLQFVLQPGKPSPLGFDLGNGFTWASDDCPGNAAGASAPYTVKDNDGTKLTIDVGTANESAVHYRLNFDNNRFFDPIIIRD